MLAARRLSKPRFTARPPKNQAGSQLRMVNEAKGRRLILPPYLFAAASAQRPISSTVCFSIRREDTKAKTIVLTLALCFVGVGVCFADDVQMGTWKLNETKSKLAPGVTKNADSLFAAPSASAFPRLQLGRLLH